MPALQVRDFPSDLYDALKAYAAQEHRSVSQQTVVAVEQMISRAAGGPSPRQEGALVIPFDSPACREARIARRKEALQAAERIAWARGKPTADEVVQAVRSARDSREAQLASGLG